MAQVLSQDEVDALLQGISEGEIPTQTDKPVHEENIKFFDLASQDRIIRGRMPTLEMIHERFCRQFRTAISNMLRRPVDISVISTEMLKYAEFMRTVPVPTSMHVFRIDPLKGYSLLVVEGKLVFALIDNFFGGKGATRFKLEGRDFTAIEQRVIRKVVEMVLEHYEAAWQPTHEVRMEWTRAETNPQFAAIVPGSDVVVAVQCELDLEESQGKLTFIIPYSCVEPIKDKLNTGFQTEHSLIDRHWQVRLREQIREVEVECHAELGHTTISGRDLLHLAVGDVIQLDEDTAMPMQVFIENVPKFTGFIGSYHSSRAVQIHSVAQPKGGTESVG